MFRILHPINVSQSGRLGGRTPFGEASQHATYLGRFRALMDLRMLGGWCSGGDKASETRTFSDLMGLISQQVPGSHKGNHPQQQSEDQENMKESSQRVSAR